MRHVSIIIKATAKDRTDGTDNNNIVLTSWFLSLFTCELNLFSQLKLINITENAASEPQFINTKMSN